MNAIELVGRRLPDGFHFRDSQPGDYWRQSRGTVDDPGAYERRGVDFDWTIRDPYGHLGTLGSHKVEEHEDGTITVTPSILDDGEYDAEDMRRMGVVAIISEDKVAGWHGFLARGVWSQA